MSLSDSVDNAALLGVAVLALAVLPSVWAISYNPSVDFRYRTGLADVTFASPIHFASIHVKANATVFDGVSLGIERSPATGANLPVSIAVWNPAAQSGTAVEFIGSSLGISVAMWFNLSGMQTLNYSVTVNGVPQGSAQGPSFSFRWNTWTSSQDIVFAYLGGAPGPIGPGAFRALWAYRLTSALDGCQFALTFSGDRANVTSVSWRFPDGYATGFDINHTFSQGCGWLYSSWGVNVTILDTLGVVHYQNGQVVLDRRPIAAVLILIPLAILLTGAETHRRKKPPMHYGPSNKVTTHRGRVTVTSARQHRWLHAQLNKGSHKGDHTHQIHHADGSVEYRRHTVETMR